MQEKAKGNRLEKTFTNLVLESEYTTRYLS